MSINAFEETFEHVELFGRPALFTNSRIDRATVPETLFCYDLRGSDVDPGAYATIENRVAINHAGTVILANPLDIKEDGYLVITDDLNFLGDHLTLD